MKAITWFCLIAIILSTGTASAQVLLSPKAVGSARYPRAQTLSLAGGLWFGVRYPLVCCSDRSVDDIHHQQH